MTDTGQVPGEGLPENAGMVDQPGVPAPGAYTYLSETTAEDEDLLLLPGAQSAWGNEVAPPAPEPVVEALHEPGAHEMSGRDSGSVDLSAVRTPGPAPVPPTTTPRRPLHLGPPTPDASASPVRSLADRGAVGAPPVRQPGPPTAGPEYLDIPGPQPAAPWGAPAPVSAGASAAETVIPQPAPTPEPANAAQAAVTRLATEAVAQAQPVQAPDGDHAGQTPTALVAGEVPVAPDGAEPVGRVPVAPGAGEAAEPAGQVLAAPGVGEPAGRVPVAPGVGEAAERAGQVLVAPGGGQGAEVAGQVSVAPGVGEPAESAGQALVAPGAGGSAEPSGRVRVAAGAGEPAETAVPFPAAGGDASAAEQAPGASASASAGSGAQGAGPSEGVPGGEPVSAPEGVQAVESVAVSDGVPAGRPGVAAEGGQVIEPRPVPEGPQDADTGVPTDVQAAGVDAVQPLAEAAVPEPEAAVVPEAPVTEAPASEAPVAVGAAVPDEPQVAEVAVSEPVEAPVAPEPEPVAATVTPEEPPAPESPQVVEPAPGSEVPAPDPAPEAPTPEPAPEAPAAPTAFVTASAEPAVSTGPSAESAVSTGSPAEPALPHPPAESAVSTGPSAEPAVSTGPSAEPAASTGPSAEPAASTGPSAEPAASTGSPAEPALTHPPTEPAASTGSPAEPAPPVAAEAPVVIPEPAPQPDPVDAQPQPVQAQPMTPVVEEPEAPVTSVVEEPGAPVTPVAEEPEAPAPLLYVADPAGPQHQTPSAGVATAPRPEQPLGQFVPVAGQVPTTPHLAPTPPQAIVLPTEEAPPVPAPRAGDPEPVQHAEDLDTRAAEQEESTAAVAEARQSTGPAAPAYDDAEREAVLKVMRERRDIRNGFRGDPIPHEVLLRVLEAAHTAPSVGHSQPWDFVVIRSAETRRTMHELAMRQRDAYAKSLPKGRAKQFKELKIEAILDTPVNIVVTADPTRGGRHTLGRHTQPQMAPYSSALAVENLWLAARAEGLGVGWVSFFDEREMVRTLGLPDHLEVVAYLCVGYVDEFPDEPELMQAGWSKRRPLSWVVHEETYGRRALPGEDPHDLLAETVAQIRPLDAKALGEAWERQKRMTKPAGALGMLEIISAQLSGLSRQCPPPIPEPAAVAIFAGDHGVHAQGVTPWPQEVTAQMVANFLGGGAVCNAFAGQVGAEVCVVDVGVAADLPATPGLLPRKIRAGTSDMTTGPAMTREEAKQAIEVGIDTARDLVAAGNKALLTGEMGIANTTASAALISVFTGADPAEVTGRGTGINDETLARKTEVVRRALEVHQPDPADPIGVLAAIGGFEHAAMVGLLLGGASLRTPVILDGVSAGAAALVARAIAPEVLAACIAGHRSAEPGHVAALNKLGLRPLVDLDLRLGEGTGALLALPLVQSTARAMHEVATFDSAGVTEK